MKNVGQKLSVLIDFLLPRLLTQVCRDPLSNNYGCFDRHWWHYKIRDFPSIILQQGAYTLLLANQRTSSFNTFSTKTSSDLLQAACSFWQKRATKFHAFEEYYPWESGYPPLAFSTLAIMKLVHSGVISSHDLEKGAAIASRQLSVRFEHQAANQQIAGLAALSLIQKCFPQLVNNQDLLSLTEKTLKLQNKEGWFEEYGGADLGYLSVTLDCLWDLYDYTENACFLQAAKRAFHFLGQCYLAAKNHIGIHNSRNTDYIVPYGIIRFLQPNIQIENQYQQIAYSVCQELLSGLDHPEHYIHAIDDRYLCHYIGHSLLRAERLIHLYANSDFLFPPYKIPIQIHYKECGFHHRQKPLYDITIALNKGGVFSITDLNRSVCDFGWRALIAKKQYINYWYCRKRWQWQCHSDKIEVSGFLAPSQEHTSNPLKHLLLRILSLIAGNHIIKYLKQRMIFSSHTGFYFFTREILLKPQQVTVKDKIEALPAEAIILPAPRASRRHVASSDSFHVSDFNLINNIEVEQQTKREADFFIAETIYRIAKYS